jgi:hypothetical protein
MLSSWVYSSLRFLTSCRSDWDRRLEYCFDECVSLFKWCWSVWELCLLHHFASRSLTFIHKWWSTWRAFIVISLRCDREHRRRNLRLLRIFNDDFLRKNYLWRFAARSINTQKALCAECWFIERTFRRSLRFSRSRIKRRHLWDDDKKNQKRRRISASMQWKFQMQIELITVESKKWVKFFFSRKSLIGSSEHFSLIKDELFS